MEVDVARQDASIKTEANRSGYSPLEVTREVRRLDMALAELHLSAAAAMGITGAELLAIVHLGTERPMSPTEIARALHLRSGAVTALLDRLEGRDYVVREPHPTDRRKLTIRVTDSCRRDTMGELGGMVARVVAYAGSLSQEDRDTVGRVLHDLAAVIAQAPRPSPTA
jgi:DNA-binding MarR family transcriptional regulator